MKIAKITEHHKQTLIVCRKQEHEAHLFSLIFMLLSNSGSKALLHAG